MLIIPAVGTKSLLLQYFSDWTVFEVKSMSKWPWGIKVASWYQSFDWDPRTGNWHSVIICKASLGDLNKTMCVFCYSTPLPSFLWWNNLCFMYDLFCPLCLQAVAFFTNCSELEISSRVYQKFCSIFGKVFNKFKVNSLGKFKVFCACP